MRVILIVAMLCVIGLQILVDQARQHAHAGYLSSYGGVEWGFVAVAAILLVIIWSLRKSGDL